MVARRSIQRLRVKRRRLFRLNAAQDTRARAIPRGPDVAFKDESTPLRKTVVLLSASRAGPFRQVPNLLWLPVTQFSARSQSMSRPIAIILGKMMYKPIAGPIRFYA